MTLLYMKKGDLTPVILRDFIRYDQDTGLFYRRTKEGTWDETGRNGSRGYLLINLGGKCYPLHRLAFFYVTGKWPVNQVDHIDGDKKHNKWNNLREATGSQNLANMRRHTKNKSGYKGVCEVKHRIKKWAASIQKNRINYNLGYFATPEEAHAAYAAKARELFGEYARSE